MLIIHNIIILKHVYTKWVTHNIIVKKSISLRKKKNSLIKTFGIHTQTIVLNLENQLFGIFKRQM